MREGGGRDAGSRCPGRPWPGQLMDDAAVAGACGRSPSTGSTSAADRAVPTSLTTAQRSRRSRYAPSRSGGIASNQCRDAMTCVGEPPPSRSPDAGGRLPRRCRHSWRVVGGAQDPHPFGIMTCETTVLALRPTRGDERDRGAGHQLGTSKLRIRSRRTSAGPIRGARRSARAGSYRCPAGPARRRRGSPAVSRAAGSAGRAPASATASGRRPSVSTVSTEMSSYP